MPYIFRKEGVSRHNEDYSYIQTIKYVYSTIKLKCEPQQKEKIKMWTE